MNWKTKREAEKQAHEQNLMALPFLEVEAMRRERRSSEWWALASTFAWYLLLALGVGFTNPANMGAAFALAGAVGLMSTAFGTLGSEQNFRRAVARRAASRDSVQDPFLQAAEPVVAVRRRRKADPEPVSAEP